MKNYKLALITGGSSGIGLALAKQLYQEGASICILATDKDKLSQSKTEIQALAVNDHQTVETLSCDIRDYEALKAILEEWVKRSGIPDLVINSAGVTYPGYFQDLDVEIYHWLMDINYYGTLHVCKIIIPKMIQQGYGTLVNISSQAAFTGIFGYAGYSASKFAVHGFSDVLRSEMKPLGIQVSVVFPPDTDTPQLAFEEPLKPPETRFIAGATKPQSAEQVANDILRKARKGKYMIIPGFDGQFFHRLVNILGNLTYTVVDILVQIAQKKKK